MNVKAALQLGLALLVAASATRLAADNDRPRTTLEDRLAPFDPRTPRTEQDEDVLTSTAHFGNARILMRQRDFAGALRHYQRAWRYNPARTPLLRQIIALASREGITRAIYGEDIPSRRSVAYSDFFIKPGTPYDEEKFIKALETQARIPVPLPELAEIWNPMEVAVRYEIVEKGGDVKKALLEATAKINEILARSPEQWSAD